MYKKNTPLVSIIIPVGFKFSGLDKCLKSFIGKQKDGYEILIGIDEGDIKNERIIDSFKDKLLIKKYIWREDSGYYTMHLKTNWLAEKTRGKFIWWLSEECRMITKNWVEDFIEPLKYANRPTLLHPHTKPVAGAKYPAINRCWYETTGHFTGHPSLDSWLNTVRERSGARWGMVNTKIREVERPPRQTIRGKIKGMGELWVSKKLDEEMNKDAKKIHDKTRDI